MKIVIDSDVNLFQIQKIDEGSKLIYISEKKYDYLVFK